MLTLFADARDFYAYYAFSISLPITLMPDFIYFSFRH